MHILDKLFFLILIDIYPYVSIFNFLCRTFDYLKQQYYHNQ